MSIMAHMGYLNFILIPIMALLLVGAQLVWASAVKHDDLLHGTVSQVIINLASNPKVWLGALLYLVTTGLYFYIVSRVPFLVIQVALVCLSVLFSTALSALVIGEKITPLNLLGVFLVICGMALVFRR